MAKLSPYLFFNGNCREAMTFYKEVLGGELFLQTVGESPMAQKMGPETHKNILHAYLNSDKIEFMASDMMTPGKAEGNQISMCLVCVSKEELQTLYKKLSEGGKIDMPMKEEFFGTFGAVNDKFGINWMVQFGTGNM